MKENAKLALLALVSCGVLYLSLEGTRSVARGDEPGISLVHAFLAERAEQPPIEALADTLQSRRELEARHQSFLDNRIMLGNTPYDDLVTTDARATYDDPEVGPRFKPNLTLRASHLRSRLFNAFDPVSYGYIVRPGSEPDPELLDFLARYSLREVTWTTDERGFRTTVPRVESGRMVALIGSSPCLGLFLTDEETLASVLQRRQPEVRFLNACFGLTVSKNHVSLTRELIATFPDPLAGVIYTLNDRNYQSLESGLRSIDEIADLLDEVGAAYRVLIYHHYIYESMPDVMRKRKNLAKLFDRKARIIERARQRGFTVVDHYDVVARYREHAGSVFAGMALYVDHDHLSRQGTEVLAAYIPEVPHSGSD
ncbi:MAG: hypothetical protein O7G30_04155 [Proteobacteria bacterium]|nr:hypothetical protein [Pseudomonadota bacterium]